MTSVDDFVRTNILTFPTLFPNRTAVLHHALCVIGNGYKWSKEGEVVAEFVRPVPLWNKEQALVEIEVDLNMRFEDGKLRELVAEGMREYIEATATVVKEVETRVHERPAIENIYPQCNEYALLMNIPANVTDEWKETCEEMKVMAKEAGWKF